MIGEFSVHARSSNNKAKTVVSVCMASALACLAVYMLVDSYRSLVGIAFLLFIVVGVFFYTKYMAAEYFYDVTVGADNKPLIVIRQRTGRRFTTLARADLWAIRRIERYSREQMKSYKTDVGVVKYVYTPTFMPETVLVLSIRSRYERADIVIEATDEFRDFLLRAVTEANEEHIQFTENEE